MNDFRRFWGELTDRVRAAAEARGTSPQQELQQFVLQRLMARAFSRDPDNWLLKGGQSVLARFPDARASGDVDLVGIAGRDRVGMTRDFNDALAMDLGDHLRFEQISEELLLHGEGVRIGHRVRCGDLDLFDLTTDLVPPDGRKYWLPPERIPFPEQIMRTGADGESPDLRAVSIQDQLAHKVSGMYMHGLRDLQTKCVSCVPKSMGQWACQSGELPHRVQDAVDVAFLATKLEWDAVDTHAMVQQDFHQRIAQGAPLDLPDRFRVPNPAWVAGFVKYAANTPGLPQKTLKAAWPILYPFVTPLLRPDVPSGRWDPEQHVWAGQLPEHAEAYKESSRQRILVVAHASGRSSGQGGLPVVSGELTKALAGLENAEVTLLTVGDTEPHGDAKVVKAELPPGFSNIVHLKHISSTTWPDPLGLPPAGSDSFEAVIGHSRHSGEAAKLIRNRWYRFANLVYVSHMPDHLYAEIQGDPDRAAKYVEREKELFQNADLVVGVGPLATDVAREMGASGGRTPSVHELIPGHTLRETIPAPEPDGTFRVLFTAHRPNDPVKGLRPDLVEAIRQLRDEGVPIGLEVRGFPPEEVAGEQAVADAELGPGVLRALPFSPDDAEREGDLRRAHVVVMPSRVEGYGMVAAEATERGVPVLVAERSGYAQALLDPDRFPNGIGAASVVRDADLTGPERVEAWKTALRELASNYEPRRAEAVQLRQIQHHYTWQHAARAMAEAMAEANPGAQRYTIQAEDGVVRLVEDSDTQLQAVAEAAKAHQEAMTGPLLAAAGEPGKDSEIRDFVTKFASPPPPGPGAAARPRGAGGASSRGQEAPAAGADAGRHLRQPDSRPSGPGLGG